jgi:glucan biosynthesis protein
MQGLMQDDRFFRRGKSIMFQYFSTILYVHIKNSWGGGSILGVENPVLPTLKIIFWE